MLRMISPKALVISNIAHWILFGMGWVVAILVYCAGATIASDGTSDLAAVFNEMKSSTGLLAATTLVFFIAPIPAGYIAAKIAPHAKLLNGALSTSAWFVFCVIDTIWGGGGESTIHIPYWLDVLTTFGIPIPAMLGAYIYHMRADRHAFAAANIQREMPSGVQQRPDASILPDLSKQAQVKRATRAGTGLGVFIFLLMQLLLTKDERSMLLLAAVGAIAVLALIGFAVKALRNLRGSA
jgi:hypothetical protein